MNSFFAIAVFVAAMFGIGKGLEAMADNNRRCAAFYDAKKNWPIPGALQCMSDTIEFKKAKR